MDTSRTTYMTFAGRTAQGNSVYRVDFVLDRQLEASRFYLDAGWAEDATKAWVTQGDITEQGLTLNPTSHPE